MTYPQAAEYLEVSKRQVQRLVSAKLIKVQRLGHRTVRISKQALDDYLKRCTK
jgi:excisionase family DNA binding protein